MPPADRSPALAAGQREGVERGGIFQIERFAPGFRERVLARSVTTPAQLEANNANLVGGDIAMGVTDLKQFFTRPTWRNYSTPVKGLYICSASTCPIVAPCVQRTSFARISRPGMLSARADSESSRLRFAW